MATDCNTFDTKGFYPSVKGKRRKMAEELCSPEFDGNISKLCDKYGVARSTLYRWMRDSDFNGYIEFLIEKYTDSELPNAWRQLIKKVNKGGLDAITLFFQLKGKFKNEVNLNGGGVTIINNIGDTDD